jgi:hypothetical protein
LAPPNINWTNLLNFREGKDFIKIYYHAEKTEEDDLFEDFICLLTVLRKRHQDELINYLEYWCEWHDMCGQF